MKFLQLANLTSHIAISQVHDMASQIFLQDNHSKSNPLSLIHISATH